MELPQLYIGRTSEILGLLKEKEEKERSGSPQRGRPGTVQYTELWQCQKSAGNTEIQRLNSVPLVLLSQQDTIKLQGTASR